MTRLGSTALAALVGVLAAGCLDPFETPAAYEEQGDLCAPENAASFDARVAACDARRAAGGVCAGVLGFKGSLEGQAVIVESTLTGATFLVMDGAPRRLDSVDALGPSPYFLFALQLKSVGGEVSAAPTSRSATIGPRVADAHLLDDVLELSLRLSTGAESVDLQGVSGTVQLASQAAQALRGAFHSTFRNDGVLDGCFVIYATSTRVEQP